MKFIWLLISGFLAWALVVLWMMKRVLEAPSLRAETLFLSVPLRFAIFALLLAYLHSADVRHNAPPQRYRLALAASFSWLLPVPYVSIVGVLLPSAVEPSTARSDTLVWPVLAQRHEATRLPLWLGLDEALRKGWQDLSLRERLWRPPHAIRLGRGIQEAQNQILKLYDLQTFGLLFDAAILGWCLSWLTEHQPLWSPILVPFFQFLWRSSLALCGIAVCIAALHLVVLLLRTSSSLRVLDREPYARYLVRTQLAIAAGLVLGVSVREGRAKEFGALMMYVCALLVILKGLSAMLGGFLPKTPLTRGRRDLIYEVGLLSTLMFVFGLGGPLGLLPRLFLAWVVIWPLRAWLLSRTLLPWLLRPFRWRDLFARDLSARLRWRLRALAAAALLPGGGLAIPLCIWIRHRRWPEAVTLAWRRQLS